MGYRIYLGVPSSGLISEGCAKLSYLASLRHHVTREPSCNSGPNFNNLWCAILNAGMAGRYTHFAMCHVDFDVVEDDVGEVLEEQPDGTKAVRYVQRTRWLDRLVEEMDAHDADFISTPMAIKNYRHLTSSGIGNPANRWNPWKRFTTKELRKMPTTFSVADTDYPDKFLLHNEALCLFDLRKPLWYQPDAHGSCRALFNFTEDIRLIDGRWQRFQESEDWCFSRNLWEMGARTFLSTRIETLHHGAVTFSNKSDIGHDVDEATASQWRNDKVAEVVA